MKKTPLLYWLALHHMKGIGPMKVQHYLSLFQTVENLFSASLKELTLAGIRKAEALQLIAPNWEQVEADLSWQASLHSMNHLICPDDEAYPQRLKEISDPPLVCYVQGNLPLLCTDQIAIIGTRHPTALGLKQAEQFAMALVETGLTITSGLALGIDAASHRGALAAKGHTIGVAGTGLYYRYPKSNEGLIEHLLEQGGAYLSEFSLDTPPLPEHFPRRNRLIAGLSLGVLVVEAALKSGSLITARCALEQGREVFALPGAVGQSQKRGCHALIRQGATLVEAVEDILEEIRGNYIRHSPHRDQTDLNKKRPIPPPASLSAEEQKVINEIKEDITPMDRILLHCGLTPSEVSSILLVLELAGHIQSVVGGYVRTP